MMHKWRYGEPMAAWETNTLKAMGYIPRADGVRRVSPKYKRKRII